MAVLKKENFNNIYNEYLIINDLFFNENIYFTKHEIFINKKYQEPCYMTKNGFMKNDLFFKKIYTDIINDNNEEMYDLLNHILNLNIVKDYYSAPLFFGKKINQEQKNEFYVVAKEDSLLKEYEYFKSKIFNKNFFKEFILLGYLPKNIKAVTTNFLRIIYNYSEKGIEFINSFKDNYSEEDLKIVSIYNIYNLFIYFKIAFQRLFLNSNIT